MSLPRISERIANVHNFHSDGSTRYAEEGSNSNPEDNSLDAGWKSSGFLPSDLVRLLRSRQKVAEVLVLGITRFTPWNIRYEQSFFDMSEKIRLSLGVSNPLVITPWALCSGLPAFPNALSLGGSEAKFDPTLISKILREFPIWKKNGSLVICDMGKMNSDLAKSLSPWCDLTLLLSQENSKVQAQDLRLLKNWRKNGFPLSAAVHVA
jgi:hypothetical protein